MKRRRRRVVMMTRDNMGCSLTGPRATLIVCCAQMFEYPYCTVQQYFRVCIVMLLVDRNVTHK